MRSSHKKRGGQRVRRPRSQRRWSSWTVTSHIALALGIGCAVSQWGVAATLLVTCMFAASGAAIANEAWAPERRGFRALLACGMAGGFATMAVIGAVAVLGVAGCLVLVPFLGTQPVVMAAVKSFWCDRIGGADKSAFGSHDAASGDRLEPLMATREPEAVELLDDAALCRTWRRSFVQMGADCSAEVRLTVVDHRRRCLDELERRSPDGFAAWLASGARAAGDPLPFLQDPRCRRQPGR